MANSKVGRDSEYRIAALAAAVARAGQDGGLEGTVDVLGIAGIYYQWLTGDTDLHDPIYEKAQNPTKQDSP